MRVMSWPAIDTWPSSGASSPAIRRKVVVLPAPVGPSRTRNSPSPTARVSRLTASTLPKRLLMPERMTSAMKLSFVERRAHRASRRLVEEGELLGPESEADPLATIDAHIGGEPGPQGAVRGGEGNDLGRAEIFGAEDLAAHGPLITEAHILRAHAQHQFAILHILVDLGHGHTAGAQT